MMYHFELPSEGERDTQLQQIVPSPARPPDVGGVFTATLESTERVIEDRRRQVLRDLAQWGDFDFKNLYRELRKKCAQTIEKIWRPHQRLF
jgi:hypothetical protein